MHTADTAPRQPDTASGSEETLPPEASVDVPRHAYVRLAGGTVLRVHVKIVAALAAAVAAWLVVGLILWWIL